MLTVLAIKPITLPEMAGQVAVATEVVSPGSLSQATRKKAILTLVLDECQGEEIIQNILFKEHLVSSENMSKHTHNMEMDQAYSTFVTM